MTDSLKTLLQTGKISTSSLPVKVIKEIGSNSFIVADKSGVAVLDTNDNPDHSKYLKNGNWYKLIKCYKGDGSTIKSNKQFKPVKTVIGNAISDIEDEVEQLENSVRNTASNKSYKNFETLSKMPNHSKIEKVTVKVITASRVITTNKGKYQICNIKDSMGNTSSINLYSHYLNTLTPFNIFSITNIRKGEVTKNDETKMRLHTTNFTKIEAGTLEDVLNFKDVGNGDETVTGTIIGFGELSIYNSCKQHFKKLDGNNKCPTCNVELKEEDVLEDFRVELYMEVSNNEETDVKEILIFKRVLNLEEGANIDEKLNTLTDQKAKIDYNTDDDQRFIAVSVEIM